MNEHLRQLQRVALVATLLFACVASAQDAPIAALNEDVETTIYAAWDDDRILSAAAKERDALSLAIARATAALRPEHEWPELTINRPTDARTLVDDYFDYYGSKFPRTTQFLAGEIERVNGVKLKTPGAKIQLPPMPAKPYEQWDDTATTIRTFSPESATYEIAASLSNVNAAGEELVQPSPQAEQTPVRELHRERARGATVVAFRSADEFRRAFTADIRQKLGRALYTWVGPAAGSDQNTFPPVTVDFYHDADEEPCTPVAPVLPPSTYFDVWKRRLQTIAIADLVARAKNTPLVLVDWDFESQHGHGRKVADVAELALRRLGLWESLRDYVERFELNPQLNRARLEQVLAAYRVTVPTAIRPQLDQSQKWIETYVPRPGNRQDVDQGILQAIMWEHFSRRQTWLNLSFSIRARGIDYDGALLNSSGYAFVAAGNTGAVPPYFFPQNVSRTWVGRAINVTYGDPDGKVRGSYAATGPDFVTSVELITQGKDFNGCAIVPTDEGSSFASPWVAAAAWVKHLVDEVPNKEIRRALIHSSRPLPTLTQPIDSGGYFDGDLLLAFPGIVPPPHAIRRDGQVEQYSAGSLRYKAVNSNGENVLGDHPWRATAKHVFTLAKCPDDPANACLWIRDASDRPAWPLRVENFELTVTKVGSAAAEPIASDKFLTEYESLHF